MAVLDTSFLIDIFHNSPQALQVLEGLERTDPNLFVAAPSLMELWSGLLRSKKLAAKKVALEQFAASLPVLPLTAESARQAAVMEVELSKKGITVQTEDVMIAAIAVVAGETVVTRDAHYTRIPGLRVLKY